MKGMIRSGGIHAKANTLLSRHRDEPGGSVATAHAAPGRTTIAPGSATRNRGRDHRSRDLEAVARARGCRRFGEIGWAPRFRRGYDSRARVLCAALTCGLPPSPSPRNTHIAKLTPPAKHTPRFLLGGFIFLNALNTVFPTASLSRKILRNKTNAKSISHPHG